MASTKQVELRIPCCHFPTFLGQLALADAASPVEAKGIGVCPSGLIISSTRAAIQSLTKRGSLLASHVGVSCPATAKHGGRPKARQIMSVKSVGRGCGLHVPVRVPRSETMLATEPENAYLVMLPDSAHKSQTVWGWHGTDWRREGGKCVLRLVRAGMGEPSKTSALGQVAFLPRPWSDARQSAAPHGTRHKQ